MDYLIPKNTNKFTCNHQNVYSKSTDVLLLNISTNKEHINYVAGNQDSSAKSVGSIPGWRTKTPNKLETAKKKKNNIMLQITLLRIYLMTKHYYSS